MTGDAIIAMVDSFSAITDKIGSGASMRLWPRELPQTTITWPAGIYRRLPVIPVDDWGQKSNFEFRSVDFHFYAKNYDEAADIIEVFRSTLEGQSGTWAGVDVNHVLYMTDTEDFDDELELHIHQIELQFNYRR